MRLLIIALVTLILSGCLRPKDENEIARSSIEDGLVLIKSFYLGYELYKGPSGQCYLINNRYEIRMVKCEDFL